MGAAELKSKSRLVRLKSEIRGKSDTSSAIVDVKERGMDVEIVDSNERDAVSIGYVIVEDTEWTGTVESVFCPKLVPTLVTAVRLEG